MTDGEPTPHSSENRSTPDGDDTSENGRRSGIRGVIAIAALAVVGLAAITAGQWTWLFEDGSVQSDGVSAPVLEPSDGEQVFRIGPGSTVTYSLAERLAGNESTATGSTDLIAGDFAVNLDDPALSRAGTIRVNIESLTSDSSLRDKRIRLDYLESQEFPIAEFSTAEITGLPSDLIAGEPYEISVDGQLTVREIEVPTTLTGTATITGETLIADLTTEVLLSDYEAGPISIAGLVTTTDEVQLDFHLEATTDNPSTPLDATIVAAAPPEGEFAATVQPIIESSCAKCHTGRGPGVSTISMATAGEVAEVADGIALVTGTGYMPPWPASDLSPDFAHDWSLSDDDIATITEWAADGGGLDVPPETELVPSGAPLREIERDDVIAGQPYVGNVDHVDDYRCQVYERQNADQAEWIRGIGFEPDATEVVHHAVFFLAPDSARETVAARDAEDSEPGWPCFGLTTIPDTKQISAWAPGQQPVEFPDDTALMADEGSFLIVQIHFHYDHEFPVDQSQVILDLEPAETELRPVRYQTYLGSAEIPCTPDLEGPLCDRDAVIAEAAELYGDFAAQLPSIMIRACDVDLEAAMADTDGVAESTCDLPIRNPGEIVSIFGHMHEIGQSIRMTLNPDTDREQILLDIPTWSFEWQMNFTPEDTIIIEQGDMLRLECSWDRSLRPQLGARYVTWNEGTNDEMCYSAIATVEPS